ncbi:hypothetical protein ACFC3F_06670 [Microbacterium sp. NPDC055910]|uniref:hypothetical protein n=1 Tax=Microbacterium sp. NPDC055910 TaxID=3345659 RepID=UPI0035E36CF1
MAVYLKYRQISQDATSAEYEIQTSPTDADPLRVRVSAAEDAPPPVVAGERIAANKAIRQILQRHVTEGAWPKGGMIQS